MVSKYSVKKPFTVLVAVILVLVLGYVSITKMTPDLLPEMSFPYIMLMTTYPGASPEEVESAVTKPLEQTMASLDDIKEITSTSAENYSIVLLTFEDSVNTDVAMMDIQRGISTLSASWDDTIGTPVVTELSSDLIPTLVAAVSYEGKDPLELSAFVNDTLSIELEGINGVASVTKTGLVLQRIEIELDEDKIDALNKKLYAAMEDILRMQRVTNVEACIAVPNEPDEHLTLDSVHFHERMGYRMVGEFRQCGYKFGRWYNMVWMEKFIGEHVSEQPPVLRFEQIKGDVHEKMNIA